MVLLFLAWIWLGMMLRYAFPSDSGQEEPPSDIERVLNGLDQLPKGIALFVVLTLVAVALLGLALYAFMFVSVLILLLGAFYGVPYPGGTRSVHPVSRATPVLVFARAVEACAKAHRAGGERHLQARRLAGDRLQEVARTLQRAHWKRGGVSLRSHRRAELKRHAGRVVAVLRRVEARLDREPHAALRELGELLLTVAERYADGRVGALLDEEQLGDVEPVRTYELLRLAVAVVLIGVGGAGIALLGLPSVVQPYALSAWGLLVLLFVYGRGVRPAPGELWGGLRSP